MSLIIQNKCKVDKYIYVLKGLSLVNNIKAVNGKIFICGLWLGVLRGGGLNIGCFDKFNFLLNLLLNSHRTLLFQCVTCVCYKGIQSKLIIFKQLNFFSQRFKNGGMRPFCQDVWVKNADSKTSTKQWTTIWNPVKIERTREALLRSLRKSTRQKTSIWIELVSVIEHY